MKACPNCRVIHQDEYMGTCQECGAPLGNVKPNGGSPDMAMRFARQVQAGSRENAAASPEAVRSRRGSIDSIPIEQSVVDVASRFIVVDKEKLAKLESQRDA